MHAIVIDGTFEVCRRARQVFIPMGIPVTFVSSTDEFDFRSTETGDLLIININAGLTGVGAAEYLRRAEFLGNTLVLFNGPVTDPALIPLLDLPRVECSSLPSSPGVLDRVLERAASLDLSTFSLPVPTTIHGMVGKSRPMREIFSWIDKVAPSNASVCIHGDSGTGKELIASALHQESPRRDRPFITLDCTAVPDGLMESHLFGHAKGAFTGAVEAREGVFSLAHTGTLFIDELCELSLPLQAKLLRVIQNREFAKVGSSKPIRTDIRLITATNKDPRKEVEKGTFRQDLYYRVAVVMTRVPSLRERREDIPLLVEHFLGKFSTLHGKRVRSVTTSMMDRLMAAPWPGNVRQLEHFIEQAVVLADGPTLSHWDLPRDDGSRGQTASVAHEPGLSLREVERRYILNTLEQVQGNRSQAAKILGISIRCLQYKVKEYGFTRGLSDEGNVVEGLPTIST